MNVDIFFDVSKMLRFRVGILFLFVVERLLIEEELD